MPITNSIASLQQHTDLFTLVAERQADGHPTGFHAGVAAVRADIARHLLTVRHDPALLVDSLTKLLGEAS